MNLWCHITARHSAVRKGGRRRRGERPDDITEHLFPSPSVSLSPFCQEYGRNVTASFLSLLCSLSPLSSTSTSNIMGGNRLSFLRTNVSPKRGRRGGGPGEQREFLLFLFASFFASLSVIRHRRRRRATKSARVRRGLPVIRIW